MFTEVVGYRTNAPGSNPTRAELEFSFLENWKEIDFHEHLTSKNYERQEISCWKGEMSCEKEISVWSMEIWCIYIITSTCLILLSKMLTWGLFHDKTKREYKVLALLISYSHKQWKEVKLWLLKHHFWTRPPKDSYHFLKPAMRLDNQTFEKL